MILFLEGDIYRVVIIAEFELIVFKYSSKILHCLILIEIEMMKERFAKLLLGEDMSGNGKGVCPALTISNAITNLCGNKKFFFFLFGS